MNHSNFSHLNCLFYTIGLNNLQHMSQLGTLDNLNRNTLIAMIIDNTLKNMESKVVYDFYLLLDLLNTINKNPDSSNFKNPVLSPKNSTDKIHRKNGYYMTNENLFKNENQNFSRKYKNLLHMLGNIKISFPEFERPLVGKQIFFYFSRIINSLITRNLIFLILRKILTERKDVANNLLQTKKFN
jgi:hypothetical protein